MEKIVEQCQGCAKVNGDFCTVYTFPAAKWRSGNCPVCTTLVTEERKDKKKINPIKKSKRSRGR